MKTFLFAILTSILLGIAITLIILLTIKHPVLMVIACTLGLIVSIVLRRAIDD